MITLKIKYNTTEENLLLIKKYQQQYSNCLHVFYNLLKRENNIKSYTYYFKNDSILLNKLNTLNNVELLNYWLVNSVINDSVTLVKNDIELRKLDNQRKDEYLETINFLKNKLNNIKSKKYKLKILRKINKLNRKIQLLNNKKYIKIFGGKHNFITISKQCSKHEHRIISNNEWKNIKLNPIYSIGDKEHTNRLFKLNDDLKSFTFKPNKNTKFVLNINENQYKHELKKLYYIQLNKEIPVTYRLDQNYIYISYEVDKIYKQKFNNLQHIQNRIMSIDLNPNYIGWVIVDWKSENKFKIIKHGVISQKCINDNWFKLKNKHNNSADKCRKYISNKRNYEIFQVSKLLINLAIYYKVNIFSFEKLNMRSKDNDKGKKFNSLCNNLWCRSKLVNNLIKRCQIFGIKYFEMKPEYSSFIGNFLFRHLNMPDMCLSAFEISRRTHEWYHQYIIKDKNIKKNIIFPDCQMFNNFLSLSLEEFGCKNSFDNLKKLYYFFKKSKIMYRLSIDNYIKDFIQCTLI